MILTSRLVFALGAVALGFAATSVVAQSAPSADQQRAALQACKNALGIGGMSKVTTSFQSSTPFGGRTVVVIAPYDQVTPALANRINACAANALGTSAPQTAAVADIQSELPARTVADTTATPVAGCVMGNGVMQRGTLLCPGH